LITSIGGAYAHLPAKRAVYAGTPGPSVAVVDANTYSSGDDRGSRHTGIPYEMTRANLMNGNKDLLGS
jgi:hypothetical protein